jgi:hypothetical protein
LALLLLLLLQQLLQQAQALKLLQLFLRRIYSLRRLLRTHIPFFQVLQLQLLLLRTYRIHSLFRLYIRKENKTLILSIKVFLSM